MLHPALSNLWLVFVVGGFYSISIMPFCTPFFRNAAHPSKTTTDRSLQKFNRAPSIQCSAATMSKILPPHNSLVRYDNPILVSTTKDSRGSTAKKITEEKANLTPTEDILNSILPPRYISCREYTPAHSPLEIYSMHIFSGSGLKRDSSGFSTCLPHRPHDQMCSHCKYDLNWQLLDIWANIMNIEPILWFANNLRAGALGSKTTPATSAWNWHLPHPWRAIRTVFW